MPFIKLGEFTDIIGIENTEACVPSVTADVLENFRKTANHLKRIAPKAEDFLYFSAVMMHAAEASALNDDGTPKLNIKGETVQVGWDKTGGTWRWFSNDPNIKPYKNSNGDIFPEEELVKAHKKWVHKPLCIDHKSSSVDHTRGFIVDTYYDRSLKRVIALCALDKANYPDLARKVASMMQTSVSMGTAVGRAICTDCARVARAEADFCDHMRRKTCYGEINVDLNPIELSIVVNGADPKANIKHIIAAANTLNSYLDSKSEQLAKLADLKFTATLGVSDPEGLEGGKSGTISIEAGDIDKFKSDLSDAVQQLSTINASVKNIEKDTNDLAFNQSSGTVAMDETETPNTDSGLAPPHERYASADLNVESIDELHKVTKEIEVKLSQMKHSLDKLSKTSKNIQEENNMSGSNDLNKKAYFQGTEEPTPGQAKYPKDKMNEDLRLHDDKQMVGQMDTGPVDGMHPGTDSSGMNELERKKMLARAEAEERALRRTAIVNLAKQALQEKQGYFQGGGGVNEPTPGKAKYPKDKLNEDLREDEDKQMVGQKPFPGVGPVDGMHPSPASADVPDEKKRKEMLQRASLKARFIKAANDDGTLNQEKSAWEVFLGDKLLLTASVDELSGGRAEILYDTIATKEFGAKLMDKVKVQGADKVKSLFKKGQDMAPPAAPAAPEAAPPADAAAPADAGAPEDTGGSGDPQANAAELADKVRDLSSDLAEAVRTLTGEQAEMGDMGASPEMGAAASDTQTLHTFRKELNVALTKAMKEAIADLNDYQQELDVIAGMYDNGAVNSSNEEFVGSIAEDAINEAKTAVADAFKLMTAFVKYARGTKAIVKRAEIEAQLEALADGDSMDDEKDSHSSDDLMALINDTNADLDAVKDMMGDEHSVDHVEFPVETIHGKVPSSDSSHKADDADDNDLMAKPDELKDLDVKPGTHVEVTASLDTREGRAALRAKLAADALGKEDSGDIQDMSKARFSDMLDQADRLADGQTHLDVKPSDSLGLVETLPEVNKSMMDVAKAPPKVRKEAEAIHKLISEGKLDPADLDALVAEGLDKDAVAYYKKYYSQVDGGGEFASELVKEHVKAQLEAEFDAYRTKISRAYELAYDMVARGLCHGDRNAISAQVDDIMRFNDESFESLKRVVAKHEVILHKNGGHIPQVGIIGSGEVNTSNGSGENMYELLNAAFSKTSKKMF